MRTLSAYPALPMAPEPQAALSSVSLWGDRGDPARRQGQAGTDTAYVLAIRQGKAGAEEAFYRRFSNDISGPIARLMGSRQEAEDVLQDTFMTALEHIDQLRDPAAVRGWLLQIAVRYVHRQFRRTRLLRALGICPSMDDASLESLAAPELSAEARSELALLDRTLSRLSAVERIAWMLRYVEGHELTEVARACNCSLATVKRRIAAADFAVQKHLATGEERDG